MKRKDYDTLRYKVCNLYFLLFSVIICSFWRFYLVIFPSTLNISSSSAILLITLSILLSS